MQRKLRGFLREFFVPEEPPQFEASLTDNASAPPNERELRDKAKERVDALLLQLAYWTPRRLAPEAYRVALRPDSWLELEEQYGVALLHFLRWTDHHVDVQSSPRHDDAWKWVFDTLPLLQEQMSRRLEELRARVDVVLRQAADLRARLSVLELADRVYALDEPAIVQALAKALGAVASKSEALEGMELAGEAPFLVHRHPELLHLDTTARLALGDRVRGVSGGANAPLTRALERLRAKAVGVQGLSQEHAAVLSLFAHGEPFA